LFNSETASGHLSLSSDSPREQADGFVVNRMIAGQTELKQRHAGGQLPPREYDSDVFLINQV
jgi:hypothetical protein